MVERRLWKLEVESSSLSILTNLRVWRNGSRAGFRIPSFGVWVRVPPLAPILMEIKIPTFETETNRQDQQLGASKIEKAWSVICANCPSLSAIDFILYDEQSKAVKGLVEFKDRKVLKEQYPTFFISESKMNNGLTLSKLLEVPLLLVVQWKDQLGWLKVASLDGLEIKHGGRKDRGVTNDLENMVHFPINKFKII